MHRAHLLGKLLLRHIAVCLCRTQLLSTETAGFASASDGELAVGQIVAALAMLLSWPEYDEAAAAARGTQEQHPRDTLLHAVRELVLKSFLHFSDEHAGVESAGENVAEVYAAEKQG